MIYWAAVELRRDVCKHCHFLRRRSDNKTYLIASRGSSNSGKHQVFSTENYHVAEPESHLGIGYVSDSQFMLSGII